MKSTLPIFIVVRLYRTFFIVRILKISGKGKICPEIFCDIVPNSTIFLDVTSS